VPGDERRSGPPATEGPPQVVPPGTVAILPDQGDPRSVGELLACWVGAKLAEVDDLVDEARDRADAIPDRRSLMLLIGELTVRLHCVELAIDELRKAVKR
jgi:hypothetical protein